ncbi:MAG: glycosyltransferase, partial [Hymenobacteraceae bacterium]|nr:glycosyltransferase [Hymenobacteraceae bacterium]MDX5396723.1 glycosyltransferase [Hymenobacteraceae bacterium]MDX5512783.1 glycosyltransferase [Hymenobacteraceae bacterium]
MIAELLISLPVAVYAVIIFRRLYFWLRLPATVLPANHKSVTFLSVIVPVRNEALIVKRLLSDLEKQSYPLSLFEVIVVDDHSDDDTVEVVKDFAASSTIPVKLLTNEGALKKAAVKTGIAAAKGTLLVFTDGDCRVQPDWLAIIEYCYTQHQAKCISGPVCFEPATSVFDRMQFVEFASLVGVGAASMAMNSPNMCNGANIAYEKDAFEAVGGFKGNEHVASGDDEFLMHKLHRQYPGKVVFLKADAATVFTATQPSVSSFVQQRVRWASKWRAYQNKKVQLLAVIVFLANLSVLIAAVAFWLKWLSGIALISIVAAKFLTDFLFLYQILSFFKKKQY